MFIGMRSHRHRSQRRMIVRSKRRSTRENPLNDREGRHAAERTFRDWNDCDNQQGEMDVDAKPWPIQSTNPLGNERLSTTGESQVRRNGRSKDLHYLLITGWITELRRHEWRLSCHWCFRFASVFNNCEREKSSSNWKSIGEAREGETHIVSMSSSESEERKTSDESLINSRCHRLETMMKIFFLTYQTFVRCI